MLPFVEVSHLPSSSSFYSAITQPLGLKYISAADPVFSLFGTPTITYGSATLPSTPVFELRQITPTAERPLKRSRVVLSANSPSVVRRFQQRVHEADGRAFLDDDRSLLGQAPGSESPAITADDWRLPVKASEADLDGNTMDVVYIPPPQYPEGYSGSTVRKTSSSEGEISRIMTWNYDVAASDMASRSPVGPLTPVSSSMVSRHSARFPDDEGAPVVRRTITTTSTAFYEPTEPTLSARQNSSGLTAGTVVSTLLGVAAASAAIGAGVAYGAMKHERMRSEPEPPSFQRRSTYPEPPTVHSQYSEYGPAARDYMSIADRRPPPTLLTRYPHSQSPREAGSKYDDSRSRHSSRFAPAGASTARPRASEASSHRPPLLLTDGEHGSYVSSSSKHTARTSEMDNNVVLAPRSHASSHVSGARSIRRSSTYDAADRGRDRDSYVSSRSHRTASTVRGPAMQPTAQTELTSLVSRPKTASRVSRRADSYASAREAPGRVSSHVSARRVELPRSGVGSSKAGYEQEDDVCSVAPSDSISCIGSNRKGSRAYYA